MDSSDINANFTPTMGLTMKGGSHFAVYDPIIPISAQVIFKYVHCFYFMNMPFKLRVRLKFVYILPNYFAECILPSSCQEYWTKYNRT